MCRFTSFCACAKSHPGICSPLKHSTVSCDYVCGQRRHWSDCVDAQPDYLSAYAPKAYFRLARLIISYCITKNKPAKMDEIVFMRNARNIDSCLFVFCFFFFFFFFFCLFFHPNEPTLFEYSSRKHFYIILTHLNPN